MAAPGGPLATLASPDTAVPLREAGIDWPQTTAWGEGGYYSRIFLNVQGREPEGTVPAADYERVRDDLARRIAAIPDENGEAARHPRARPDEIYPEVNGVAPDLIVHFGDLFWRSVGTVGGEEGIHSFENDTGPDDANHAQDGLFVLAAPGVAPGRAKARTSWTWPRRCSSSWDSTSRPPCAVGASSRLADRAFA